MVSEQAGDTGLLAVSDTAAELSVSAYTVYRLIRAGELDAVDVDASGKRPRIRVTADSVRAFIQRRRIEVTR